MSSENAEKIGDAEVKMKAGKVLFCTSVKRFGLLFNDQHENSR